MAKVSSLPSWKIFAMHLKECQPVEQTSMMKGKMWAHECCGRQQQFAIVWLQGKVTDVSSDGTSLSLNDGTGDVQVIHCNKLPSQCVRLNKDQYGMVIGELVKNNPIPIVRAIKLQDLASVPGAEDLWKLEVIDQNLACLQQMSV